jgi:organic hydroperoxide reductase OsmC/OhrA
VRSAFPYQYQVAVVREGRHAVLSDGFNAPLLGGPPPEFGGSDEWWSPEHLLLGSVGVCFLATFQALATQAGLRVEGVEQQVRGSVDKTGDGVTFASITIHVTVTVAPGEAPVAARLLQSAKRHCIVVKSLKASVELLTAVRETRGPVAAEPR